MLNKLASFIFIMFICSTANAATQLKKVVAPSGGDYTSLEACMNANEQNLVTADKYFDVEISGTWSSADTTAVTIHNYTTDATHYINIYTTGSARHSGVWSTAAYRLITTSSQSITISNNYLTLTGVQVKSTYTSDFNARGAIATSGSPTTALVIDSVISIGAKSAGFAQRETDEYCTLKNSIFISTEETGLILRGRYDDANYAKAYNCTCITYAANKAGVTSAQEATLKNTYAYSITSGYAFVALDRPPTYTTCASSDSTAPGTALDNIAYSTDNFVNVTSGSEDLHLVLGSALIDVGTDLGSPYNVDIHGETRSGTWDIGADEYVATATPSTGRRRSWIFD